jgi:GWxTD domain-containing protein
MGFVMKRTLMGVVIWSMVLLCGFYDSQAKDAVNHNHANQTTVADSLYQIAIQSLNTAPIKQGIDAFKQVIHADGKYAPAYYQLSRLYAALNTVNDRQRATRAIKEAIRLDKDNIDYQLALGDLLWQQEFYSLAEEQYRKAFLSDSLNVEAAFQIGSRALDAYLKYKDQQHLDIIQPSDPRIGPSYNMVYWKLFGDRDLNRATAFLDRATQIDPTYCHAYYRLGLAYYESNRPDQLVQVCARLLKYMPGDKDALLFMALGFQATNQLDQANKLFNAALKRMEQDERAVMESLDLVTDPETQQQIQQVEATFADHTQPWVDSDTRSLFWQKQDPLHLTDYNERRMAHYGRVAYANLRYSRPEHNIPGWQTDMGQAYIKYGRPLSQSIKRADDLFTIPLGEPLLLSQTSATRAFGYPDQPFESAKKTNFQTETWVYENFRLEFVEADGYNGHLTSSTPEMPRYIDPYIRVKYSAPYQILAFKEPANIRLEIAYALPSKRFNAQSSTLDDGLFIFDSNGREIDKQIQQADVQWPKPESHWDLNYVVSRQIYLSPGDYDILVESRDQNTGHIATFRETRKLTIPDTALSMSDLYLTRRIDEKTSFPESRNDLSIFPNPTRTYGPSDPVYVYFEVYNLKRNDFGRTRFDIAYHISSPEKEEIDPALFIDQDLARHVTVETFLTETQPIREREMDTDESESSRTTGNTPPGAIVESRVKYVLPKSRETDQLKRATQEGVEMATAITAEYEGDRRDDFTYLQFNVSQLPKGIHKLTVTITDQFANTMVEGHTLFRVVE